MIEVTHITKRFLDREVLKDITFRVDRGEIVGFLGPNGAGKTTTLRILTGYLPATSGRATVAGHDVFEDSLAVRRSIGYLPENVPMYPEMRVNEFLRFRSNLKGVPKSERAKGIDRAMEQVQIGDVRTRIIGQLSKGYRQRVGLADALLGKPQILILDEPTVGLDPNQIRQTRQLIRDLGKDHTILLSTHILPEVEAVATRVVIVHHGRLVGEGRPDELKAGARSSLLLNVEARGSRELVDRSLGGLPGFSSTKVTSEPAADVLGLAVTFEGIESGVAREGVFAAAVKDGWVLRGLEAKTVSLEDVFADLTTEEKEAPTGEEAPPTAPPGRKAAPSGEEANPTAPRSTAVSGGESTSPQRTSEPSADEGGARGGGEAPPASKEEGK
ncbi:MAG: ATP-binding cassette domain-containing protein [Deltaproteobacteria bacterium]|nr:ATP-binding cassette domain-containing protein [Deltaproteobacteria bacterium]